MAWLRWFSSSTFTVPNGVTKLKITAVGGSGAGGSALASGAVNSSITRLGGGGGGGGQVVTSEITVAGGQQLTIEIGRGAAASTQTQLQQQITNALNNSLPGGMRAPAATDTVVKRGTTELVKALGGKSGYNDTNSIDRLLYSLGTGGAGGGEPDRAIRDVWHTTDPNSNLFRANDGQTVFPTYTALNNDGINQFQFDNPNKYYTFGGAGDAGGFLVTNTGTGEVAQRHPRARFRLKKAGQAGDGATAIVPSTNTVVFEQGGDGGSGVVTIEWEESGVCVEPVNTTNDLGTFSNNSVIRTSRGLYATVNLLVSTTVATTSSINSWYKESLGRPVDKDGAAYWSTRVQAVGLTNAKNEFISAAQDEINALGKTVHVFTFCQAQCIYTVLPGNVLADDYAARYLENMVLVDSNGFAKLETLVLTPNYNGPKDNNFGDTLIAWYKEVANRLPDAAGYRYWLDTFKPLTNTIDLAKAKETFVDAAKLELEKNGKTTATYSYAESLCLNLTFTRPVAPSGTSSTTTTTTFPPSPYNFCHDIHCQLLTSPQAPNFIPQTKCNSSSGEIRYTGYHGGSGRYEVAYMEAESTWFTSETAARNPTSVGGIWRLVNCANPANTFDTLAEYNVGRVLIYADNFIEQNTILVASTKTTDAALVNGWYQSELGRPADQAGLNSWVATLASARIANIPSSTIFDNFKNAVKVSTLDVHGKVTEIMAFCQYQSLTNPFVDISKNGLTNGTYFLAIRDTANTSLVTVKSVVLACSGTVTNFEPPIKPPITLVDLSGIAPANAYVYTRAVKNRSFLENKYDDLQKGKFQGWDRLFLTNNNTAPLLPFDEANLPLRSGVPYFVAVYDSTNLYGGLVIKRILVSCQSNLTFDIKVTGDVDVACAFIVASNFRGGSGEYEVPQDLTGYFLTREAALSHTLWQPLNLSLNLSQTIRIRPDTVGQCFYYAIRDKLTQEIAVRPVQCGTLSTCTDLDFEVDTYCSDTNCNTFRMLKFSGGSRRYEVPFGATKFFKTRHEAENYNVFVETFESSYNISGTGAKPGFCYYFVLRDAVTKQRIIKAYSCGATAASNGCFNPLNFELWPQTTSTTTTSPSTFTKAVVPGQSLVFEPRFVILDQDMFPIDDITNKAFLDTDIPFKLKVTGTPPLTKFTINGNTPDGPFFYNETTNVAGEHVSPFNVIKANGIANLTLRLYESLYSIPPTTSTTTLRTFVPQASPSRAFVNQLVNLTLTNGPTTAYSTAPVSYTRASSPGPVSRMFAGGETLNGTFTLDTAGTGTVPMTFNEVGQAVITFSFIPGSNYHITKNPLVHIIDVVESTISFDLQSQCNTRYGREIFVGLKSGSPSNKYNVYLPFDTDLNTVIASNDYVSVGAKDTVTSSVSNKGTYYVRVADSADPQNAKVIPIQVTCDLIDFTVTIDCPNVNISNMIGDTMFRVYVPSMISFEAIDYTNYVIVSATDIVQFSLANGTHYIAVATRDGVSLGTRQITVNCDNRITAVQPTSTTTSTTTIAPCDESVMVASNGGINFTICPSCDNSKVVGFRGIYTATNFSGAINYEINYTKSLTQTQSEDGPFSNPTISLVVLGLGNATYYVTLRDRDDPTRYATKSILINCSTGGTAVASTCPLYMSFCSFESFGTINSGSRDQFIDTGFGTFE